MITRMIIQYFTSNNNLIQMGSWLVRSEMSSRVSFTYTEYFQLHIQNTPSTSNTENCLYQILNLYVRTLHLIISYGSTKYLVCMYVPCILSNLIYDALLLQVPPNQGGWTHGEEFFMANVSLKHWLSFMFVPTSVGLGLNFGPFLHN